MQMNVKKDYNFVIFVLCMYVKKNIELKSKSLKDTSLFYLHFQIYLYHVQNILLPQSFCCFVYIHLLLFHHFQLISRRFQMNAVCRQIR